MSTEQNIWLRKFLKQNFRSVQKRRKKKKKRIMSWQTDERSAEQKKTKEELLMDLADVEVHKTVARTRSAIIVNNGRFK